MLKFGIPGLVKLVSVGKTSSNADQGFDIPLQTPVLDPLPEATYSGRIKVSGFAGSNLKVKLMREGQETDTKTADNDGNFSFDLVLRVGENNLGVTASDDKGKESNAATATVIYDNVAPEIEIREPQDEAAFGGRDQQVLNISGKLSEEATVTINDNYVSVDSDNFFTYKTKMSSGVNEYVVKATDKAGNTSETLLRVTFSL